MMDIHDGFITHDVLKINSQKTLFMTIYNVIKKRTNKRIKLQYII